MLTLLVICLLIFAIGGGGYGFRSGWYGGANSPGLKGIGLLPILLLVIALFLLFNMPGTSNAPLP